MLFSISQRGRPNPARVLDGQWKSLGGVAFFVHVRTWKVIGRSLLLMKLGRLLERSDMTERFDSSGYCDDLAALLLWRIDYCFVSLSDRI